MNVVPFSQGLRLVPPPSPPRPRRLDVRITVADGRSAIRPDPGFSA